MDRNKLKQTLKEQAELIDEAVQKKLAYLNDDFLATDEDFSTDVFTELLMEDNAPAKSPQKMVEATATADKIAVHKQSLAEKIAVLRGISSAVPSGYMKRRY